MLSVIFVSYIELKNDYKIESLLYLIVYRFGDMCHCNFMVTRLLLLYLFLLVLDRRTDIQDFSTETGTRIANKQSLQKIHSY